MIPIKLTIEGLYSYQARQEIDFTKLSDSHIFGIFGSVGSGKSSILEAITFALYGKTDRLNLSGDNRNYNMMNLKSDSLFIEFEFMVGSQKFMITVKGRRNSKRFEDVKALDRQAYKEDGGQWTPIELSEVEESVGLSYENFKRTIIIPQGKFKEFLELGNKDRTQMMKELFNLNKFELYYKVTALESKNNKELENLKGQLHQLGDTSKEQLEEAEKLLQALKNQLDNLYKSREEKRVKEKELSELKELTDKLKQTVVKLRELNKRATDINTLEKKIESYEYCLIHFKALIDSINSASKKITSLKNVVKLSGKELEKCESQLNNLKDELKKLLPQYEKRSDLKSKAEELAKIYEIINLSAENKLIKERVEKGKECVTDLNRKITLLKNSRTEAEKTIEQNKKVLPNIVELTNVKEWFVNLNQLNRNLKDTEKKLELSKEECSHFHHYFYEQLKEKIFEGIVEIDKDDLNHDGKDAGIAAKFISVVENTAFFNGLIDNKNKAISGIEETMSHCMVQKKLEEYADQLEDGRQCPLCGSKEHPAILKAAEVNDKLLHLTNSKKNLNTELTELREFILKLREKRNNYNIVLKNHKELLKGNYDIKDEIDTHKSRYCWKDYENLQAVEKELLQYNEISKKINDAEDNRNKINKQIDKETVNQERYKTELDRILSKQVENETKINTLKSQIKFLPVNEYLTKSKEIIKEEESNLLKTFAQLEEQYERINKEISNIQSRQAEIKGKLEANRKALDEENAIFKEFQNLLDEKISQSAYLNVDEVSGILSWQIDLDEAKKKLKQYKSDLQILEKTQHDLEKQINSRIYNVEEHTVLIREFKQVEEEIEKNNRETGSIDARIKKIKHELEQKKDLQKRMDKLSLRAEDIKTMKKLFKASGFVNYVSSVHLQNLCKLANERFHKLTRQKLRLEITEDNNFQVRDFMNGGKVRNVKTLSGGQTFQASLSLALALADSIQKFTNSSQNFFFLDEGFGSLDKDALGIVFETLKSLRKEDRIIGVISHVEEMQQEIEVFVKVKNKPESGSLLEFSWN